MVGSVADRTRTSYGSNQKMSTDYTIRTESFVAGGLMWRRYSRVPGETRDEEYTGPPVVILHGLFGSGDNWRSHAQALAAQREVLVPDMPGHGESMHPRSYRYPVLAEIILNALEELGLATEGRPVSLLGHSMGGKVAMAIAFVRPEAVGSLIIADIAPREYPPRHEQIFDAMNRVAAARPDSRSDGDTILSQGIPERSVRLFLLKSLVPDDDGYRWQLDLNGLLSGYDEIRGWPFTDDQFPRRTLIIAGGDSPYVSGGDTGAITRHLPAARIETIPDAGHWLHVEARERFLSLVVGELDQSVV
jgi:esterase